MLCTHTHPRRGLLVSEAVHRVLTSKASPSLSAARHRAQVHSRQSLPALHMAHDVTSENPRQGGRLGGRVGNEREKLGPDRLSCLESCYFDFRFETRPWVSMSHRLTSNSWAQGIFLPQSPKQLGLQVYALTASHSPNFAAPGGRCCPVCPFFRAGELKVPSCEAFTQSHRLGCRGLASR